MPPDQAAIKRHTRYENMNKQLIEIEARIAKLENMLLQLKRDLESN